MRAHVVALFAHAFVLCAVAGVGALVLTVVLEAVARAVGP